jgi:uncharacterized protein (TIGR03435 family)
MTTLLRIAAAAAIVGTAWLPAQAQATAPLAFEAASIRQHTAPLHTIAGLTISGTLVTMEGYSVSLLVAEAYNLKRYQLSLSALPHRDAIEDIYYDIVARAPGESVPSRDQFREMLKTLLADRFQLVIHRETKEMRVYALVAGDKGPKLKQSKAGVECSGLGSRVPGGQKFEATGCAIGILVDQLANMVDRPVLDKTGLTGTYDFTFIATPAFMSPGPDDTSPFSAIHELGLKLVPQNAPIGIVFVDHVEKPNEN